MEKEVRFDANNNMGGTNETLRDDEREEKRQGFVVVQGNQGNTIINGAAQDHSSGSTRILLNFQDIFAMCNPLGLTLKKTPSLSSLLEMQLSTPQQAVLTYASRTRINNLIQPLTEKLKASNFPISSIKIGAWQRASMNGGDLIAKLYYAKRKIVWEVLDGPLESRLENKLKSKIEIVWSDMTAIQATMQDGQYGSLKIELDKPPMFFRETNPQAGKHTNWQVIDDFTNGQASIWRVHCLSFPPKVLDKHYEKLLQCDQQLYKLSQEPFPSQQCPYFRSALIMTNFKGFGSTFAPVVQQYGYPTLYPTMSRGLPIRPPPQNPAVVVPYKNQEGPSNYHFVARSQRPTIWGNQGRNIRGNINPNQLGPSMIASQTPGNNLALFDGNNHYQPNGALTLDDIEKHLALDDSQAGEANLQIQMQYMDSLTDPNNNPNDHNGITIANSDQVGQNQIIDAYDLYAQPISWLQHTPPDQHV